jgi:hypothetical protein
MLLDLSSSTTLLVGKGVLVVKTKTPDVLDNGGKKR